MAAPDIATYTTVDARKAQCERSILIGTPVGLICGSLSPAIWSPLPSIFNNADMNHTLRSTLGISRLSVAPTTPLVASFRRTVPTLCQRPIRSRLPNRAAQYARGGVHTASIPDIRGTQEGAP